MRKYFVSAILLVVILALSACNNLGGDVSVVKNGTLEFDKSLTVGQALAKYKYFKKTEWENIKTDNGKRLVNVVGDIDISKYPYLNTDSVPQLKSAYLKFQFVINQDKTFEMKWCGLGFEKTDGEKKEPDERISLVKCMNTMKEIFNNEPKEASAEEKAATKAAASNKEGCSELQTEIRNSKTLMEGEFADNQKYPDHVPFEVSWNSGKVPPSYIVIKRIDNVNDTQNYTIKGTSEKCSKAYQTSSTQSELTETYK